MYDVNTCVCRTVYLFELDHDVFGQLHVFKHPLQLAGECCSALCRKSKTTSIQYFFSPKNVTRNINDFFNIC